MSHFVVLSNDCCLYCRSLSFATRRASLQGVDNDPTFIYDPIVLLRYVLIRVRCAFTDHYFVYMPLLI